MRRSLASLAALMLAAMPALPPAPAEAQTVIRACFGNHTPLSTLRVRFVYRDWQNTSHTDAWTTLTATQRHCRTLQDVRDLRLEVEFWNLASFGWTNLCNRNAVGNTNVELVVVTQGVTTLNCVMQQ